MEIGKENLPRLEHAPLRRLRLLHLDDHVRAGKDLACGFHDLRAGAAVIIVVHADPLAGIVLDQHLMPVMDGLAHAGGGEADAVFQNLDLFRHADTHLMPPWDAKGNPDARDSPNEVISVD